jgi:hypothetical protein
MGVPAEYGTERSCGRAAAKHPDQADSRTLKAAADNAATIALLEKWAREDATNDTQAIAEPERDLAELKIALNANRPPDRPVFP